MRIERHELLSAGMSRIGKRLRAAPRLMLLLRDHWGLNGRFWNRNTATNPFKLFTVRGGHPMPRRGTDWECASRTRSNHKLYALACGLSTGKHNAMRANTSPTSSSIRY
jgi:hypothetical protein